MVTMAGACIWSDTCADSFFGNVCELDLVFNFYKVGRLVCVVRSVQQAHHRVRPCRSMPSSTRSFWQAKSKRQASLSFLAG